MKVYASCFALTVLGATVAYGQSSLPVFTDSLQQGWQNWSWATVNFNNASPARTGTKSIAVTMGSYQALAFNKPGIDTAIYKSFRFWVHGGANGGQRFNVKALVNGQPTAPNFAVGPVTKGVWTQVEVPLSTLAAGNVRDLNGFWLQSSVGSNQATLYVDDVELLPEIGPVATTFTINAAEVLQPVDDRMFGVNTAIWDQNLNSTATINLMKSMGSRLLRFPGGSASDTYDWKTGRSVGNTWAWATDFDDFANVLIETGQSATITVNYGSGTPQDAADWVRYANLDRGLNIKYWDVGNENFGTWEYDINVRPNDPVTYANRFLQFWQAMRAVDPSIKIGVPVATGEDTFANYTDQTVTNPRTGVRYNGWTPGVLARLKVLGITPDYVVLHRYEFGTGEENDDLLLQRGRTWETEVAAMRQQLTDYLGPVGASVEIQTNENNSCYSAQGKQSVSVVNAMYYLDSLAQMLKTEARMFCWWDWRNGKDTGGNNASYLYGWRIYGDLGMGLNATDQYPTYYAAKLMKSFAKGGDQTLQSSSNNPFLSAYGALGRDGSLRVLTISKRPVGDQTATLNLTGYSPASSYEIYRYGMSQDTNARNGTGSVDVARNVVSGASPTMSVTSAPYTGSVLVFTSLRKVMGTLTLQDWQGAPISEAEFEFRNPGTGVVMWRVTAPIQPNGAFTLNGPPTAATYRLSVKPGHWLRRTVSVDLTLASVTGQALSLINGDIDDDDAVTVFDYDLLSQAFDAAPGSPTWNPAADLDGDGAVTVFDYDILSQNFDQSGD